MVFKIYDVVKKNCLPDEQLKLIYSLFYNLHCIILDSRIDKNYTVQKTDIFH